MGSLLCLSWSNPGYCARRRRVSGLVPEGTVICLFLLFAHCVPLFRFSACFLNSSTISYQSGRDLLIGAREPVVFIAGWIPDAAALTAFRADTTVFVLTAHSAWAFLGKRVDVLHRTTGGKTPTKNTTHGFSPLFLVWSRL